MSRRWPIRSSSRRWRWPWHRRTSRRRRPRCGSGTRARRPPPATRPAPPAARPPRGGRPRRRPPRRAVAGAAPWIWHAGDQAQLDRVFLGLGGAAGAVEQGFNLYATGSRAAAHEPERQREGRGTVPMGQVVASVACTEAAACRSRSGLVFRKM